jgi:hypothetical protein
MERENCGGRTNNVCLGPAKGDSGAAYGGVRREFPLLHPPSIFILSLRRSVYHDKKRKAAAGCLADGVFCPRLSFEQLLLKNAKRSVFCKTCK